MANRICSTIFLEVRKVDQRFRLSLGNLLCHGLSTLCDCKFGGQVVYGQVFAGLEYNWKAFN